MVERLTLYRAPTTVCNVEKLADWLRERLDSEIEVRERFLDVRGEGLAERFAEARVFDPYDQGTGNTMLGIVRYEERALSNPERAGGVLYDGLKIQRALNNALPEEERDLSRLHVPVLDRALATWGNHDKRWHKRASVLGQPALISVPGLYEAPAKPKEYYKEQQRHAMLSGDTPPREVLENEVEGEFLIENDPRTTEALKGYVLSAYHYLETGEAFCESENCRLYNAHRQPALIEAQLRGDDFCARHAELYEA